MFQLFSQLLNNKGETCFEAAITMLKKIMVHDIITITRKCSCSIGWASEVLGKC